MLNNLRANGADHRVVLAVMCLALAAVVSAVASLNVALPSLARELRADQTQLQWIIDAYAVVFAALLLPAGALGDRYGRRRMLLIGLTIFGTGSVAATFATAPSTLIAIRAVLGLGAALVMPATLSIITNLTPPEARDRAVALWAGVAGGSAVLGLLVTGLLLEWFSWPSAFVLNAVLAATALVATALRVPESADAEKVRVDATGALLSAVAIGALVYGIIEAPDHGWLGARTLVAGGFGVASLGAFVAWELRRRHPLLDVRLFRERRFAAGTISMTLQFFCFFGFVFLVLQQLQLVRGLRPLTAALAMLPMAVTLIAISRRVPKLAEHRSIRAIASAGLTLMAIGFGVLALVGQHTSYWAMVAGLVALGAGMALATTPATTAILDGLPPEKQGVGSAVNDTARELGGAFGIAVLGSLLSQGYRSHLGDAAASLPPALHEPVRQSLGAALQIGHRLHDAHLASAAQSAFMSGYSTALWAAAGAALAGALVVNRLLAGRSRPAADRGAAGRAASAGRAHAQEGQDRHDGRDEQVGRGEDRDHADERQRHGRRAAPRA